MENLPSNVSNSEPSVNAHYRVHGDNIIECERTLELLRKSLDSSASFAPNHPSFLPFGTLHTSSGLDIRVDLLAGHGRWGVDIQDEIVQSGAPLREAGDFVITRVLNGGSSEVVVLSGEFCSALPAGNNAWQRSGRAISYAIAGIPYLFIGELGGLELDSNREIKAPRSPNPAVPFSHLTTTKSTGVACLPIYSPSPSCPEETANDYQEAFGTEEGHALVKGILMKDLRSHGQVTPNLIAQTRGDSTATVAKNELIEKGKAATSTLTENRHRNDTIEGTEWGTLLSKNTPEEKEDWLSSISREWKKKISSSISTSDTFDGLRDLFQEVGIISPCSDNIPVGMVPSTAREPLAHALRSRYGDYIQDRFFSTIAEGSGPLVTVWVTGFKPTGNDSRPDRGVTPLARMLFGLEAEILTIVYGPPRESLWETLRKDPEEAARQNGLIESIYNLADLALVDSVLAKSDRETEPFAIVDPKDFETNTEPVTISGISLRPNDFSEHDVDTAIHRLFDGSTSEHEVLSGFCNPPGGDWSGVSLRNHDGTVKYRWTSLPRVTNSDGKRPDHIVQVIPEGQDSKILSIESKDRARKLDSGIGNMLTRYVRRLVEVGPVAENDGSGWDLSELESEPVPIGEYLGGGTFLWNGESELRSTVEEGSLDFGIGVEFSGSEQGTILHVSTTSAASFLIPLIRDLVDHRPGRLEVQVH